MTMDELPHERPLAYCLVALAGTPQEFPVVEALLERIAQLAVDRIAGVSYASVTALGHDGYTTVAASSELVDAVDAAQYGSGGPCVQALVEQNPIALPQLTTATMLWPNFYEQAHRLGLRASLSVPMFVGSGACAAVLNLYSRQPLLLEPLIQAVYALYYPRRATAATAPLDAGGEELLDGLTEALLVRGKIRRALQIIMVRDNCGDHDAYLHLISTLALTGRTLPQQATEILASGTGGDAAN